VFKSTAIGSTNILASDMVGDTAPTATRNKAKQSKAKEERRAQASD